MYANFYCGISATTKFCYKIAYVTLVSFANQPIFSVTKTYVHVRWDVKEALSICRLIKKVMTK